MNNKIIGVVIGVLILGVVIFSGMNSSELSAPRELNLQDKIKSTGLTNAGTISVSGAFLDRDCPGGIEQVTGGYQLRCIDNHGDTMHIEDCQGFASFDLYDAYGTVIGMGC
ncbi:hypothetical protein HON86_00485 [Candidatus Woesearchaeota archaeon]|jgi:hypothetical protein|nr:hypothetical protein [Candidatus Woesearchaeota archaeon]MBT4835084.1 hypothetical protein [Candidatus Woesearchaeota archaeon]MBT6735040.1 hypothetical protein [Candidatus Woesearchaeota archaeon]MBT7169517.1 hypothetical protein [Candidatus Woesearchaeota archaeon]